MDFEGYTIDLNAKCVCGCMEGDRIHKIYRFPNGYGASVVSSPKALKGAKPGFRMYVLHYDAPAPDHSYCIEKDTPVTDDFLDCRDWNEVEQKLRLVFDLPAPD
jgi:hypothetical protein